ncbi:MAG: hypothetical protein FD123_2450 [Bacteroidetes bacterium]|nr:MAG: hypothetical protein FD123_2450 [Bacteroidota bacterium]
MNSKIMKRIPHIFLCIGLLLMAASCSIKPVTVTGVQDVKIEKLDMGGITFSTGLKINNPNKIGFGIYGSKLNVKMNGVPLGEIKLDKKVKVRRKSEDVHTVKLSSTFQDMLGSAPSLMQMAQKKNGNVEITGYIKVGAFLFRKKFPVNLNQAKVPVEKGQ